MVTFTKTLEQALHNAIAYAKERRHELATLEHLLLALVDEPAAERVMRACAVDLDKLREVLTKYFDEEMESITSQDDADPIPATSFQRVLQRAVIHVQSSGWSKVTGANILVAIFAERESHAAYFLQEQDMTRYDAVTYIAHGVTKDGERQEEKSLDMQARTAAESMRMRTPPRREVVVHAKVKPPKFWYVSYALVDNKPERPGEPPIVDKLCEQAEQKLGRTILRDTKQNRIGDSITRFMDRLSDGNRVFVFLSEAYLRSPFCMYELHEIWRKAETAGPRFDERVRIHLGHDVRIRDVSDWLLHFTHWENEKLAFEDMIKRNPSIMTDPSIVEKYKMILRFTDHTISILTALQNYVHAQHLEELIEHGFTED